MSTVLLIIDPGGSVEPHAEANGGQGVERVAGEAQDCLDHCCLLYLLAPGAQFANMPKPTMARALNA
jgi:hypothetical protein